ncbi:hypothetical protein PIROE2DRAFT_17750 [Piromyces sp. E2]|nr:hypothetical protein PIROE2DRAFT_17750 [Piromyces sp. E2]|eukprot:OUM57312.1 hypothetical protein PIROE2DRAFT_17750 [Piromyces sp. E2]
MHSFIIVKWWKSLSSIVKLINFNIITNVNLYDFINIILEISETTLTNSAVLLGLYLHKRISPGGQFLKGRNGPPIATIISTNFNRKGNLQNNKNTILKNNNLTYYNISRDINTSCKNCYFDLKNNAKLMTMPLLIDTSSYSCSISKKYDNILKINYSSDYDIKIV